MRIQHTLETTGMESERSSEQGLDEGRGAQQRDRTVILLTERTAGDAASELTYIAIGNQNELSCGRVKIVEPI